MWITILEVIGVIGGVATVLGLFLAPMIWLGSKIDQIRAESKSDWRHMDSKMDDYMKAIQQEIKDFHGRLCAIEERRK